MSSDLTGFLIVLIVAMISINLVIAMYDDPVLLAFFNQIFLAIILIAVISYLVVWLSMRKAEALGDD